jgi:hypothetical protein
LGNLLFCFGGVRVGQSFVLFWWGSCWAIFCFVLVGFVLGNLLFSVQCFIDRCLYCVLFLLAIILSVILRLTASDNRFDIFKLFLLQS